MIARARPNPTRQIRRCELEQFQQSIETWERQGQEAGRDGDAELAAGYAEDVADLRAIVRLIETGALEEPPSDGEEQHSHWHRPHNRQFTRSKILIGGLKSHAFQCSDLLSSS